MFGNHRFSVIDIETTGLFPRSGDRIVEIAIIQLDSDGSTTGEYETLINPERDVGPSHIHKITAGMVKNAPRFTDVAGDILDILADTVIVAHNVRFAYRFLQHEYARLNVQLPEAPMICTLSLSREVEPCVPSRRLEALCNYFNIPHEKGYSAYSDCLSTSMLFSILLNKYKIHENKGFQKEPAAAPEKICWPILSKSNIRYKRCECRPGLEENKYIKMLIERLPITGDESDVLEYLNLLDDVLADRRITEEESNLLFDLASDFNITQTRARKLHEQYIAGLIRVALIDGPVTGKRYEDIKKAARILDLSGDKLDHIMEEAVINMKEYKIRAGNSMEYKGKTVCFIGTFNSLYQGKPLSREVVHKLALEHGMVVKGGVTRCLDYLVAADTGCLSGKARKAEDYKVKIISEQAFWNMLGVQLNSD